MKVASNEDRRIGVRRDWASGRCRGAGLATGGKGRDKRRGAAGQNGMLRCGVGRGTGRGGRWGGEGQSRRRGGMGRGGTVGRAAGGQGRGGIRQDESLKSDLRVCVTTL